MALAAGITEGASPQQVRERDDLLRRLLVLGDFASALLALLVSVNLAGDDALRLPAIAIGVLVIAATQLMRLDDRDELVLAKTTLREVPSLFHVATLCALVTYLGQGIFVEGTLGPRQGLVLWALFLLSSIVLRAALRHAAVATTPPERCLVIGDDRDVDRVREKLCRSPGLKAEIVAAVTPAELPEPPICGAVVAGLVRERNAHRVIVASAAADSDQLLSIIRDAKAIGLKVSVKPRLLEVVGSTVEFEDVDGDVFLAVPRFGLARRDRRLKRAMDVAGAVTGLLLLSPVLAVFAIAIKVGSRGPVFFRQERIGRDGKRFRIWKFRTMVADAEQRKEALRERAGRDGLFKLADDPRITRVGALLRKTSLDELPQLINVLTGDMAMVGPRPLVADEDEQIAGWHRRRLHLTPGMTGPWQVMAAGRLPLDEMVALDYRYIVDWSPWRDVQIVLRTLSFVLRRRGM